MVPRTTWASYGSSLPRAYAPALTSSPISITRCCATECWIPSCALHRRVSGRKSYYDKSPFQAFQQFQSFQLLKRVKSFELFETDGNKVVFIRRLKRFERSVAVERLERSEAIEQRRR